MYYSAVTSSVFPRFLFPHTFFHLKINLATPCGISHYSLCTALFNFLSVYVLPFKMDHEFSEAGLIILDKPFSIQTV